jgi:transglutaminase-like putative cysteine protease
VRSLGLAARFVSGYIYVPSRDGSDTRGGGATHAWAQVYLPGAGWVEFDPTNGIVGNRDLIRVAVARDPAQAIPLSGSYYGAAEDDLGISVQVNVTTDQNSEGGTEKPPVQGNEAPREGFTERSRDREPARSTHPPSPLREASRT